MTNKPQSADSHTRWNALYHFIASPIVLLNLFVAIRHAMHVGGRYAWWQVVFAFGVLCAVFASRTMALIVQDRLIRLEMRLRLRELLPAAQHGDIARLTVRQMVALRFAGDAELPGLVQRVMSGELTRSRQIKAAITDWQADWQRA
jgi:hypothetical protein